MTSHPVPDEFAEKGILVTGGTKGVGAAVVQRSVQRRHRRLMVLPSSPPQYLPELQAAGGATHRFELVSLGCRYRLNL